MLSVALDWDDEQIRLVAGESDGVSTRLRHAAIVPVGESGLVATLQSLIAKYSLQKCPCLVAVGRDQAELRQMDFPPVPVEELPDMVRFQAIRQFASAGDSATVDFITTQVDDQGIKAIVSATGPNHLKPIHKIIDSTGWTLQRIALRPIASAALYRIFVLENRGKGIAQSGPVTSLADGPSTLALIDLVSDEAEIVLLRRSQIVFVRSVRLPSEMPARTNALAGEIRRSMMACGAAGTNCNVIMWGVADRHAVEIAKLGERLSEQQEAACLTQLIDPLELVGADDSARQSVGQTVGRLAPLVGLLAANSGHADKLIDFENPRKTIEVTTDRRKVAAMVGVPVAVVAAIVWMLWGNLARLDRQIEQQMFANAELRSKSDDAEVMIDQTARIDQFLNGDVNWLEELQRLATTMPSSDQLILREVNAASEVRDGGGRLVVSGRVTSPAVIDEFEATMRDDSHQIIGDKVTQLATEDAYRWQMTQTILVAPDAVQSQRYERIQQQELRDQIKGEDMNNELNATEESDATEEEVSADEEIERTANDNGLTLKEVQA
ncbi:hypothetical protein [Neorhodopirellula pilleata]|uniref:Competence protein A n=1 Tax=Neorhodopirellula pilleata TaxID=2714738 RepID=A0A5C5ZXL5_9BACT|nr:hypothetical protein [Neorhodopirellula pilleata]TWT91900.1 hypothetical protein Pla100_49400 [Neorhodopirellula pilleata]